MLVTSFNAGVSLQALMQLLGHANLSTTAAYLPYQNCSALPPNGWNPAIAHTHPCDEEPGRPQ